MIEKEMDDARLTLAAGDVGAVGDAQAPEWLQSI
jgi:hypothetical protein